MQICQLPLDHIIPNPAQPRQDFDPQSLQQLADSITSSGLINPITVEATADPHIYILEDGERRWRAYKLAGLATITAVVKAPTAGDDQRLTNALVANLHRADLNPIEEANAYSALVQQHGSIAAVAHLVAVSQPTIANRLILLDLPPQVQQLVAAGKLQKDRRVIDAILSLPPEEQLPFAKNVAHPGVTVSLVLTKAKQLLYRLGKDKVPAGSTPALYYARRIGQRDHSPLYDQLAEARKLPPWPLFMQAAEKACKSCSFYDSPAEDICRECPAVQLVISTLALAAQERDQ